MHARICIFVVNLTKPLLSQEYTASNDGMTVNTDLEIMWKETALA